MSQEGKTCEVCRKCAIQDSSQCFSYPCGTNYICRWCDVQSGQCKTFIEKASYATMYDGDLAYCNYCKCTTECRVTTVFKTIYMCPACWKEFDK